MLLDTKGACGEGGGDGTACDGIATNPEHLRLSSIVLIKLTLP